MSSYPFLWLSTVVVVQLAIQHCLFDNTAINVCDMFMLLQISLLSSSGDGSSSAAATHPHGLSSKALKALQRQEAKEVGNITSVCICM
jgi:hypothetical protein